MQARRHLGEPRTVERKMGNGWRIEPTRTATRFHQGLFGAWCLRENAMIRTLKQGLAMWVARMWINNQYRRYGRMIQFKVDPSRKTIEAEILLAGETEPITIQVESYNYARQGEAGVFTVNQVTVSREWMSLLANELLVDKPLVVPASAAKWLGLLI